MPRPPKRNPNSLANLTNTGRALGSEALRKEEEHRTIRRMVNMSPTTDALVEQQMKATGCKTLSDWVYHITRQQ